MQKQIVLTSKWHAEHPFAGRNTQQTKYLTYFTSRFHLKCLWHLPEDGDAAEPLALAVGHVSWCVNDVTVSRIPSAICAKVWIPPDTLSDLNTQTFHVRVPKKIPAQDSGRTWRLVIQTKPASNEMVVSRYVMVESSSVMVCIKQCDCSIKQCVGSIKQCDCNIKQARIHFQNSVA